MKKKITDFLKSEDGIVLIEYALLAAFFAVVLSPAISTVKDGVSEKFSQIISSF
jgi:Flp pilus assembly pilin Flp